VYLTKKYNGSSDFQKREYKFNEVFTQHIADITDILNASGDEYNGNAIFTYISGDGRYPTELKWNNNVVTALNDKAFLY
jgi:hypothetical protein